MGKKYLASVATVELFDRGVNGALTHFATATTLTDSSINFQLSMEEVRAGQGGKLFGRFGHSAGMTFQMTDAMFNLKYVQKLLGAEMGGGEGEGKYGSVIESHKFTVPEGGATGTVTINNLPHDPVNAGTLYGMRDAVAWIKKIGTQSEEEPITAKYAGNKAFTFKGTLDAGDYCVTYFYNNTASTLMKISANFIPSEVVAVMKIQEFAGDASATQTGKPAGYLYVKIPRLQLDGQFDLALNMTSAASVSLNGTALAVADGAGCEAEQYYAEFVEEEIGAAWQDGLKFVAIDDNYVAQGDTPVVYGFYADGSSGVLSNNDIIAAATAAGKVGFSTARNGGTTMLDGDGKINASTGTMYVNIYDKDGKFIESDGVSLGAAV